MKAKDLVKIESELQKRLEEILKISKANWKAAVEDHNPDNQGQLTHFPSHPADLALTLSGQEIELSLSVKEKQELTEIERALEKLKTGAFGSCEGCGNPIGLQRLQALPFAKNCIDCQRDLERLNQKTLAHL